MSNLSDIGFPVQSEKDVNDIIMSVLQFARYVPCPGGVYLKFSDPSGAELYLQGNPANELIGFNPHFEGQTSRLVRLTQTIERDSSELDGGFHAWAEPDEGEDGDSGAYPFVFDVPDFRVHSDLNLPQNRLIQLTAFASNDFQMFAGEQAFHDSQESELKYAAKSFIPSGLFNFSEGNVTGIESPRPVGVLTGEIKDFALKRNEFSGENFYWFAVETFGGEVDVVADTKLIRSEPQIGGIVTGQFWLSGKLLTD